MRKTKEAKHPLWGCERDTAEELAQAKLPQTGITKI